MFPKLTTALLATLAFLLVSCETISYYGQAARGQLAIVFGRDDIQRLLADQTLDPGLREKLHEVLRIREFATQALHLPAGDSFSSYVDLGREHAVWNVFAAPEFSTESRRWCYPVAGCVSYRGYFSEAAAQRYAQRLARRGFDVYTGGVDAYSTLGWFEDPLLSTVLERPDYQLAALIFHELAHRVVWLPGDTTFNESFATALEREGLRRWLQQSGRQQMMAAAATDRRRRQQFIDLVSGYRERFAALYSSPMPPTEMRTAKARLQERLRQDYASLRASWDGYGGYDEWFARPLNNAQLATVGSYNDLAAFFEALLADCHGDLQVFYGTVRAIADLDQAARQLRLSSSVRGCDAVLEPW